MVKAFVPKVICLILGGGRGTRLYPLTKSRSKPAVPIGGKYRLIDIPISNCIHSGLNQIFVITQFNSVSLHRHLTNTYAFDPFGNGFVEVLAAQQTMQDENWYQGTADAVRRNIPYFTDSHHDLVLILSGDQLYRMDFRDMIRTHYETKADVSIATLPVDEATAAGCGIMRIEESGRIIDFLEKPKTPEQLAKVRTDPAWLAAQGIEAPNRPYLASMGIYLFGKKTMIEMLNSSTAADFGKEIFPQAIGTKKVQTHMFDGYWEDIGTIGAFHQANIDLTKDDPPFDFSHGDQNIYTRPRYLACSRVLSSTVRSSLISDGCVIGRGTVIENSIIGVRATIGDNVTIRNSYIMGADSYEPPGLAESSGGIPIGIGRGSVIENAIVDKNARIGREVRLVNERGLIDSDDKNCFIRDRILVVPKSAVLRDGVTI